jgi:membrane-associated phospholipid phosphatase
MAVALSAWALYAFTNHLPPLVTSTVLSYTPFEKALPLLPWAIWPYLTCYFVIVFMALDLRDIENFQRLLYGFMALQLIANFVFVVCPVSLPRDRYPIPADAGQMTRQLFEWTRLIDTDRNCLPSLHVANCWLISLVYLRENRTKILLVLPWLALVSFSTLGTKQHYLWDILAGATIATLVYVVAYSQRVCLKEPRR